MIIKRMDSKQDEIAELTALLKGRLTSYQRFSMEREVGAKFKQLGRHKLDFHRKAQRSRRETVPLAVERPQSPQPQDYFPYCSQWVWEGFLQCGSGCLLTVRSTHS